MICLHETSYEAKKHTPPFDYTHKFCLHLSSHKENPDENIQVRKQLTRMTMEMIWILQNFRCDKYYYYVIMNDPTVIHGSSLWLLSSGERAFCFNFYNYFLFGSIDECELSKLYHLKCKQMTRRDKHLWIHIFVAQHYT